jgi:ribose transport system substrate-binding protein
MKRNQIYYGLIICIILLVIAYAAYAMLNFGKDEQTYRISIIVDGSGSDRWTAFKEGIEQGATDHGLRVNIVSAGEHIDADEEYQAISAAIDSGSVGIILEPCRGDETNEKLDAALQNKGIVLIDTDIEPEEVYTTVMPDPYEVGKALAEELMSDIDYTDVVRIGIFGGNQDLLSMQRRLEGFNDALSDDDVAYEIAWIVTEDEIYDKGLKSVIDDYDVDCIVAFDNEATEQAIDAYDTFDDPEIMLYGEGCSEKVVYYLDKGTVKALVVPNEFEMGYECMSAIAAQLNYGTVATERHIVDFIVVDRDNMYDEENQKLLFPNVQ